MISIHFCNDHPTLEFKTDNKKNNNKDLCVEHVITILCKKLKIRPLCQQIFGLKEIKVTNNKTKLNQEIWLNVSKKLSDLQTNSSYQFRIRFLPHSSDVLKKLDSTSYAYLFYQIRFDFLAGNLPDHTQQPKDGLGLVVTDIVHHLLLHNDQTISDLDISTFMPKTLRSFPNKLNVKSTTENLLKTNYESYIRRGPEYIRYQYLQKVEEIGRPGGFEKYSLEIEENGTNSHVDLYVDPFHPKCPGLYYNSNKKVTNHLCTIEELVFVSVRKQDLTVEVSRENGVPCYLVMPSRGALESFVGCLSGYYRLMKTWTFDICRELPSPSLSYLRSNKCHGPVGKDFALKKLKTKGGGESGIGILRCSSLEYNVYKLTVFRKSEQSLGEYIILQTEDGKVKFKDSEEKYDTLQSLVEWAVKTNYREMDLKRLLPPSDLDIAYQLLIYASTKKQEPTSINSGPRVMHMEQFIVKDKNPIQGAFSQVYHVQWSGESGEELAIKMPKLPKYEKENYLDCLNKFLFIEGDCVVKVYGVTLSPLSLVMEYLPLGPLSVYLRKHGREMRQVDLVEASSYLAKALWDLHSKGISHYNIRCHNVLVAEHTEQRFKVKLGDPGKVEYGVEDIHWLPREHLWHPSSGFTDPHTDTWAFGTTLWEIFSLGESPLFGSDIEDVRALYAEGYMLSRPELCPKELYQVILSCWHPDPHFRKHPQVIMRDIKQIFYYIFNSRRENQYEKINNFKYAKIGNGDSQSDENEDDDIDDTSTIGTFYSDQLTVSTETTTLTLSDGTIKELTLPNVAFPPLITWEEEVPGTSSMGQETTKKITLKDLLMVPVWDPQPLESTDLPMPLELNNCSIEIHERIGKGNYGYVFKGRRIFKDKRTEDVALKRLQSVGNTSDFKKEMNIMKNLRHENIVQFHCLAESDQEGRRFQYMVMEYLPLGSLQDYLSCFKENHKLTSDKRLLAFAMDIAKGMDYLESQQIIHRDLAARNVLVASEDHVKITDFGLAQRPNQGNYYILRTMREMPLRWYALESIERGKFSHKTDVWSYGVTLWEMFSRGLTPDLPNDGVELIRVLKNGTRLVCKGECKPYIYSKLIRPCWDEDPAMRPEFTKIMSVISELQEEI